MFRPKLQTSSKLHQPKLQTSSFDCLTKITRVKGSGGLSNMSNIKMSKNVQNWQLCIICQLSKSQTVGPWMILIISIAND